MVLALSVWWTVGWAAGILVVAIAAVLVLTITGLGRRIVRQADDITTALDGTRANTAPLFELEGTNNAMARITHGLRGEPADRGATTGDPADRETA